MTTVSELEAKIEALHELAVQANQNCMVVAGYLKHHRPGLAGVALDWCTAVDAEILKVLNED